MEDRLPFQDSQVMMVIQKVPGDVAEARCDLIFLPSARSRLCLATRFLLVLGRLCAEPDCCPFAICFGLGESVFRFAPYIGSTDVAFQH